MSEIKEHLYYSDEHEWAEVIDARTVRVGITDFAQSQLGDIVFVELPSPGTVLSAGDGMGTIESVKTVSDLFSPVSGTVVRINESLNDRPEIVNSEPYGEGWLVEIEIEGPGEEAVKHLMTAEQYAEYIESD